jgi:hypothetical protein
MSIVGIGSLILGIGVGIIFLLFTIISLAVPLSDGVIAFLLLIGVFSGIAIIGLGTAIHSLSIRRMENDEAGDNADDADAEETMQDHQGSTVSRDCPMFRKKNLLNGPGYATCISIKDGMAIFAVLDSGRVTNKKHYFSQAQLLDSPWVVGRGPDETDGDGVSILDPDDLEN